MSILDEMDKRIAVAEAEGRKPVHFLVREIDWFRLLDEVGNLMNADPPMTEHTYRGVLVRFDETLAENGVGLWDS